MLFFIFYIIICYGAADDRSAVNETHRLEIRNVVADAVIIKTISSLK